ncbi:hypothetical protein HY224_02440 [Candidatus Uhrbacteria bacterium]|nr:hypothetical protein [Candidatus Uhrbacteria bacterium]
MDWPRRPGLIKNAENSYGDDLENVKNCYHCFTATDAENCRYSFFLPGGAKDVYDADHVGLGVELACELMSGLENNRVAFGNRIYNCHDVFYSDDCHGSEYLFGCIGMRKKSYCIFNKQYSADEYEKTVARIIEQMNSLPYLGAEGRIYKYGEFFPIEISPFAYNETMAHDYFPLTKEAALKKGYKWRDAVRKTPALTKNSSDIASDIKDVPENITAEVIGCAHEGNCSHQCAKAFKIMHQELKFYKAAGIPLPILCPNCRHYERMAMRNPLRLWPRQCSCQTTGHEWHSAAPDCGAKFETTYTPERSEKVFCEKCYLAAVI